jgi:hypothetical protein
VRSRRLDRLLWIALVLICTLQALDPDKDTRLRTAIVVLLYAPVLLVALGAAVARWRFGPKTDPTPPTMSHLRSLDMSGEAQTSISLSESIVT